MKFSKVALSYGPDDSIILPLEPVALASSPFVVKTIDGLEPPTIDIKISNGRFQGRKPANKEVTISLGLRPNYKAGEVYSDLRDQLYSLLTPKFGYPVTLHLLDERMDSVAHIEGHIKSMSPNVFVKEPDMQLVLSCFDAYLLGPEVVLDEPETHPTNPITFYNPGNAPSGLKFKVTLTVDAENITFSTGSFGKPFKIEMPFKAGDSITISSETGSKTATAVATGANVNLLRYLSPDSRWIELHAGVNELYLSTTARTSQFVLNSLSFVPKYWGV